jgi:hypothetical protein
MVLGIVSDFEGGSCVSIMLRIRERNFLLFICLSRFQDILPQTPEKLFRLLCVPVLDHMLEELQPAGNAAELVERMANVVPGTILASRQAAKTMVEAKASVLQKLLSPEEAENILS